MRTKGPITTTSVAALQPGDRLYSDTLTGFYCERGVKFSRFGLTRDFPRALIPKDYGRTCEISIGRAPPHGDMTPKKAREAAEAFAVEIKAGRDPRTNRLPLGEAQEAGGMTLSTAWQNMERELVKLIAQGKRSPRTLEFYSQAYERLAEWHGKPLRWIVTARLTNHQGSVSVLRDMHERLTAERGDRSANAALQTFKLIYVRQAADDQSLPPWRDKVVRYNEAGASTAEKAKTFDLVAWNKKRLKMPDWRKRLLLLFTLATGARKSDILNLRWENVDLEKRQVTFVAPKGNRADKSKAYLIHLCPLAHEALCMLDSKKRGGPLVFANRSDPKKPASWPRNSTPPHILRSYLITISERPALGLSEAEKCAMTNHAIAGVRRLYVGDVSTVRAFDLVGAVIEQALWPQGADVVSLAARRAG